MTQQKKRRRERGEADAADETAKILTETYDASQDEIASWLKDGAVQYNSTLQGVMNLSDFMVEENFLDKGASSIDQLVFDNVKGE